MLDHPAIGIVGAGRRRNGLGPFLASALERAGARIVAVAGRDAASAAAAAADLRQRLGHPVDAAVDLHDLVRRPLDAIVVASPMEHHEAGLEAALAAGLACLAEKPFVPPGRTAAGLALIDRFRQRGLLLWENCQWPMVLPAFRALYLRRSAAPRAVAMGLSPIGRGRDMVEDSLPHLLSVLGALLPLGADTDVADVRQTDASADASRNSVQFRLRGDGVDVAAELQLQQVEEQPRPAWLAIDGDRMDRRIGKGYAISFASPDGREVPTEDPLALLCYGFVQLLREPDPIAIRQHADAIAVRLRLYAAILAALD